MRLFLAWLFLGLLVIFGSPLLMISSGIAVPSGDPNYSDVLYGRAAYVYFLPYSTGLYLGGSAVIVTLLAILLAGKK